LCSLLSSRASPSASIYTLSLHDALPIFKVWSSTQHPSEMQTLVARCLNWPSHRVEMACRRMGGGFGGKESQSALYACLSAIAAQDRKSTRLNSSHVSISYAVFCLKKKKT